jgi:hypothetical protein
MWDRPATVVANATVDAHRFANLFPLQEGVLPDGVKVKGFRPKGAGFQELVADIKTNGRREAIPMYGGKILDGRTRSTKKWPRPASREVGEATGERLPRGSWLGSSPPARQM